MKPGILKEHLLREMDLFHETSTNTSSPWMTKLRQSGREKFSVLGVPTRKLEEWKYLNLQSIDSEAFSWKTDSSSKITAQWVRDHLVFEETRHWIVLVNGIFSEVLSNLNTLPSGVHCHSLAKTMQDSPDLLEPHLGTYALVDHAFAAINTAFLYDGAWIQIDPSVQVEAPIQIIHLSESNSSLMSHPRNLYQLGKGSQATLIESFVSMGDSSSLTNAVTEIVLEEKSALQFYKLQLEKEKTCHISTVQVQQSRSSRFHSFALTLGSALTRNDLGSVLGAPEAHCSLHGLYLAQGQQQIDNHTVIEHATPDCTSHEYYKGILDDRSRGIFNGRIIVQKDAQKSNSKQSNKNLLLSDRAEVDSKPELIIYADDVKCAHGSTTGNIDEEALFYLQARGIGADEARSLLTRAFATEITEEIKTPSLKSQVVDFLIQRLSREAA